MNDFTDRSRRHAGAGHEADGEIARDLAALAEDTRAETPLAHTMLRARNRAATRAGSPMMAAFRFLSMRPLLSTLAAVALGLFVAFGLPISFDRTVGHDVALTLDASSLDAAHAGAIAREMKSVLGAENVQLEAEAGNAGTRYELSASVPNRDSGAVRTAASALASALSAAGIPAHAEVTPRTEHVSGTMYAYAADRVVRISMDGKSDAQVESEIRNALLAAGLTDADVTVERGSDGTRRVEIGVEAQSETPGQPLEVPTIELTENGRSLGGDAANSVQVRVKKVKEEGGSEKLVLEVTKDGRDSTFEVPNVGRMSDADLRFEIQSQLDRAGMDCRVDVMDGKISIEQR